MLIAVLILPNLGPRPISARPRHFCPPLSDDTLPAVLNARFGCFGATGHGGRRSARAARRNVIRTAVLYVTAVWALAEGIAALGPVVGAPEWMWREFLIAAAIRFPLWIAFVVQD